MPYQIPTLLIKWRLFRGLEIWDPEQTNGRPNCDFIKKNRCWRWPEVACALGWLPEHVALENQIREARKYLRKATLWNPVSILDPGWFAIQGPAGAPYRCELDRLHRRVNLYRLKVGFQKRAVKT